MSNREIACLIVAVVTLIAGAAAFVGALLVLPPGRSEEMPWWERARRTFPARIAPAFTTFVLAQAIAVTTLLAFSVAGFRPRAGWFAGACLVPNLGPMLVGTLMAWLASPRRRPVGWWLAGCISAVLMRFPNTVVYSAVAAALALLPKDLPTVLMVLLVGAAAMAFASWGGGVWAARVLGLARPALPRAALAADWAAERVGMRPAGVYELRWPMVRVDAFIFSRYLVITDAAAATLDDDELLALCVRELTFFRQPWLSGILRAFDGIVIYFMLVCTAIGWAIGGPALLIGTLFGFAMVFVVRPFYRRAQLKADSLAAGAAIDPVSALRALARQFELNLQPLVAISASSPDAHLYDRIEAAGVPANFPRPEAPSKGRIFLSVIAAVGTFVLLAVGALIGMDVLVRS